jgi:hypothetical protein
MTLDFPDQETASVSIARRHQIDNWERVLPVVLWYHTRLISERSPVRFPAGRTKNFSLLTAAVTSPTA